MRNSVKNLMALLIVFSAIAAKSADSAETATIFKIVAEKNDKVRVIYQAAKRQNVTLQLIDDKNQVVYSEGLSTDGFVKRYDLANLPNGSYQIELKSNGQSFKEDVKVGDISGFNLSFNSLQDRAVSLVGSHKDGKSMTLFILDESEVVVYKEEFKDTKQVHKMYNFENLKGDKVSFVVYHNDQLVKNQSIEF